MSMMAIMDMLVMSEASNGSARGTEYPAVKKETHRQYAIELKRRIVEETFAPGASVSIVARRHDVNANLVFTWRQRYRRGELGEGYRKNWPCLPAISSRSCGLVSSVPSVKPLALSAPAMKTSSQVQCAFVQAAAPEIARRARASSRLNCAAGSRCVSMPASTKRRCGGCWRWSGKWHDATGSRHAGVAGVPADGHA